MLTGGNWNCTIRYSLYCSFILLTVHLFFCTSAYCIFQPIRYISEQWILLQCLIIVNVLSTIPSLCCFLLISVWETAEMCWNGQSMNFMLCKLLSFCYIIMLPKFTIKLFQVRRVLKKKLCINALVKYYMKSVNSSFSHHETRMHALEL